LAPRVTTHEGDGSVAFNPLSPVEIDLTIRNRRHVTATFSGRLSATKSAD